MSATHLEGPRLAAATGPGSLFVGRQEMAAELGYALTEADSAGAVLVAPAGLGKTALVRHVLGQLEERVFAVQLRGSPFARDRPFGVLTYLLAELSDEDLKHPLLVLDAVARLLRSQAAGRRVILVADNVEDFDGESATLLRQIALRGDVRVALLARDFSAAPPAFLQLSQEASLQRFEVPPLAQQGTAQLAAAELAAPLSRQAARVLHRHSAGNPRFLRLLCGDYVASGALRQRAGTWVSTGKSCPLGVLTLAAVSSNLHGLDPTAMDLARLLVTEGPLPLGHIQDCGWGSALDQLQEVGVAIILHRPLPVVAIANRLTVEALSTRHVSYARSSFGTQRDEVSHARVALPDGLENAPQEYEDVETDMEEARRLIFLGQYTEAAVLLEGCASVARTVGVRFLARALLHEARAMTGCGNDVLVPFRELGQSLVKLPDGLQEEIDLHLAAARLVTGPWQDTTGRIYQFANRSEPGGTRQELADGVLLALAGRIGEAVPLLQSVQAQLHEADPDNLWALAAACITYCRAVSDEANAPAAVPTAPVVASGTGPQSWLVRWLERHFAALAQVAGNDRGAGVRLLRRQVEEARALNNSALELMALAASARLASTSVTDRMLELSAKSQAPFYRLCRLYAKGLAAADTRVLLQTAELAKKLGHLGLAGDAARQAEAIAARVGGTDALRKTRRDARAVLREMPAARGHDGPRLSQLTARERDVARLVAQGQSNRAVAEELGVSTRTAEGHLYQIFAKLLVRSRADLTELLNRETSNSRA
ncbi:MAG: LuxR C-terminal-related transcriptional regulator [Actinomycetota bacterium]